MRRELGWLGVGILAATAAVAQEPPALQWATDLERARAQAREQGRPLLVVFR